MKKIENSSLTAEQRKLVDEAIKIRQKSYSPYSNFKVGAALYSISGQLHTGCNIESADYTLSSHAEMVAIDQMVKSGELQIKELAVCFQSNSIAVPCGLCRQKMVEFSNDADISIICVSLDSEDNINGLYQTKLSILLPNSFSKNDLIIEEA